MIVHAHKNKIPFEIVLCLTCERGSRTRKGKLPYGWTVASSDDSHRCPRCSTRDPKLVEALAAGHAEQLLASWFGRGLIPQSDSTEEMQEDLAAAFTKFEEDHST